MTYDPQLEVLLDQRTSRWPGLTKKAMFGGVVYLLNGNMCVGAWRDYLLCRVGPADVELRKLESISQMDITGRAMSGWIKVAQPGWRNPPTCDRVIGTARQFAAGLPGKVKTK
jgi:hypothetical protein